jgi:general L-amino acid transport system substrate-binding protein
MQPPEFPVARASTSPAIIRPASTAFPHRAFLTSRFVAMVTAKIMASQRWRDILQDGVGMSFASKGGFAAVVAVAGLLAFAAEATAQSYRLCALRDGAAGPCTCEVKGGVPGEYVTVARSRCRPAPTAQKPSATATPATPQAAAGAPGAVPTAAVPSAQSAPAPVATSTTPAAIETGGLPVSRKVTEVRARGKLLCGINTDLLGFSKQTDAGSWIGLDVDFCRAVAAAVFGDANKVEFVPVDTAVRFDTLKAGKIDLLARNTTWTMDRDVAGLEFAGILYIDGQGFMTSDERGLVSAQQLSGLKVCVESGTTSEANAGYYFKTHAMDVELASFPNRAAMLAAYGKGECDAVSGDRTSLFSDRAGLSEPEKHAVLPEVISKEPLGPVVLQDDREWIEVVRWTLAGLVNAEEAGLTKQAASGGGALEGDAARLVDGAGRNGEALGLSKAWLRDVVGAVGNYGEMFDADLGKGSPLGMERGINALWKRGGVLYAPPMW